VIVTIIICTHNRAGSLRKTLETLAQLIVPEGISCEALVVDNASSDNTVEVVRSCTLSNMALSYMYEPGRGLARARNSALAARPTDVAAFIDDDVRPQKDWLEKLCAPIVSCKAQAVVGGVRIARYLVRPWMTPLHRAYLADTERLCVGSCKGLVGANMALSRDVFLKIPRFDEELGPGALGFWDDTLFALQLSEANIPITFVPEATVEHFFDESRLLRASFKDRSKKEGQSRAYVAYHWHHKRVSSPGLKLAGAVAALLCRRVSEARERTREEGISECEMRLLRDVHFYRQYMVECQRPRRYEKRGLVKLSDAQGAQP
jgi:glucosyl-dolichyl phosphate glucuronosyltransferase